MPFDKIKASFSSHGLVSSTSSKVAVPPVRPQVPAPTSSTKAVINPVKSQAPVPKPAQAIVGAKIDFGKGPATVQIAVYNPSAPESIASYGTCAIYLQNKAGPDILQRICRPKNGRFGLDRPIIGTVPPEAKWKFLIEVGTIPKNNLTAARHILKLQQPDNQNSEEEYISRGWVRSVLDWCADNEAFVWAAQGQSEMMKRLPKG